LFATYIGNWRKLFREQVIWPDLLQDGAKRLNVVHSGPWKGKRVADMDYDPVVADLQIWP